MQKTPENFVELSEYWHSLAGGETPERSQFHLEDVPRLLPYLMMCDFEVNPFRLRYRLSGTRVDQMTGMNLAGHYLDEFLEGAYVESVRTMLGYYEEASRTGKPRMWTYPWAGHNPNNKLIWVGIFPLKVDGVIAQCIAIEDYGNLNVVEDGELVPTDLRADWLRIEQK